jgi:hypothetical protein
MLSNDEEHELALLEASLRESGFRRFLRTVEGPVWRQRWKLRALFAFGVLVTACGIVTGSDDLVNQGVLVTGCVSLYWVIMFLRAEHGPPPRPRRGRPGRLPGSPRG